MRFASKSNGGIGSWTIAEPANFLAVELGERPAQTFAFLNRSQKLPMAINYKNKTFKRAGPDRLLVGPSDWQFALFTGLAVVPLLIALVISLVQEDLATQIVIVLLGVAMSTAFVLAYRLQWRYSFDRERGEFTRNNLFSKSVFPLTSIRLVDVQDGGLHEIMQSRHPSRSERGTGRHYRTYICRVVIETDGEMRELALSNHSDRKATKKMAREIAKFVGVSTAPPKEEDAKRPEGRRKRKKRR